MGNYSALVTRQSPVIRAVMRVTPQSTSRGVSGVSRNGGGGDVKSPETPQGLPSARRAAACQSDRAGRARRTARRPHLALTGRGNIPTVPASWISPRGPPMTARQRPTRLWCYAAGHPHPVASVLRRTDCAQSLALATTPTSVRTGGGVSSVMPHERPAPQRRR